MTGDAGKPGKPPRQDPPSVLARLEADGRLTLDQCSLRDPDSTPPDEEPVAQDAPRTGARLEVLGEIARGGVGIVLRARDSDLGRDVAMKIIRDEHLGNDEVLARFVEEAQIGGQLQHPGIVPVYELGLRPEGQPYFTMKLVKGRTFAQIFEERKSPADGLRRLLSAFESVCQTIAYAHARGVVHRDLKPLNVMVGAFAELQVVDWGLAKVLDQEPREAKGPVRPANVSIIETVRGEGSTAHSRVGSVLGTPAYMPPEQARGDVDAVDQRSDVFALGAILCEILTGAPPYTGDPDGLVAKAADADLADAMSRLDACDADPDIVAVAKSCLAPAPSARPKDAGVVAKRMADCFAAAEQRARNAQLEAAAATVRANTAAKSRGLTTALASTVVIAAAAGIGGFLWLNSSRAERVAEADRTVEAELGEAAALLGRARASHLPADWVEAVAAAKAAEATSVSRGASASTAQRAAVAVRAVEKESEEYAEETAREERDRVAMDLCEEIRLESWDVEESVTDARYAAAFASFGIDPEKSSAKEAAAALGSGPNVGALATALDAWADVRTRLGRPADVLRAAARVADPEPWRARLRDAKTLEDLEVLAREVNVQTFSLLALLSLADALGSHGDVDGAVALLGEVQAVHPGEFAVNARYAYWLGRVRPRRAEETIRYALAALARRPNSAALWNNLGKIHAERNDRARAAEAYDESLRLNPQFAAAHANRARLLFDTPAAPTVNRPALLQTVIEGCRAAIGFDAKCVTAYTTLGRALAEKGDTDGALEALREGARVRPDSSEAHWLVGVGLETMGRRREAEAAFRQAVALDPGNAAAHGDLSRILLAGRDLDGAIRHAREATRLDPDSPSHLFRVGAAAWQLRDPATTLDVTRREIRLVPTNTGPHYNLGYYLRACGLVKEAERATRVAAMFASGQHQPNEGLAVVLFAAHDFAGAARAFEGAIEIDRKCLFCRVSLGLSNMHAGLFTTAAKDIRAAKELAARDGRSSSAYLASLDRYIEIVERLGVIAGELPGHASGATDPATAQDCLAVAFHLTDAGRGARATDLYRRAFEMDPSLLERADFGARLNAAFEAAAAGSGQGEGAALGADARAALRRQSLAWLREELARASAILDGDPAGAATSVSTALQGWMFEERLAGVRGVDEVSGLPADEQADWNALWNHVEALRARTVAD